MASQEWHEFDELAERARQAYLAGDVARGRALRNELLTAYVVPHMTRRMPQLAHADARPHLEDAMAEVVLRIDATLARGSELRHRFLASIYRRTLYDVMSLVRDERERIVQVGITDGDAAAEGDDAAFARMGASTDESLLDGIEHDALERLLGHLRDDLRRPEWAQIVQARLDGWEKSPDIERVTGIRQGRVRQMMMDIRAYLDGPGREILRTHGLGG